MKVSYLRNLQIQFNFLIAFSFVKISDIEKYFNYKSVESSNLIHSQSATGGKSS